MNVPDADQLIDKTDASSKTVDGRSGRKKSSPKAPTNETETTVTSSEKKRKAPKLPVAAEQKHVYETKSYKTTEKESDALVVSATDQEVPVKTKKKRAPKVESNYENNDLLITEEPTKKKKSKASKAAPIDDEFQVIEASAIDQIEPYVEPKPKVKKSKKSKPVTRASFDSFEDLQVTNLDDAYPIDSQPGGVDPDMYLEAPPPSSADGTSEFQQSILDSYSSLASKVDFSQYVGNDKWYVDHLPKSGRTEPKSRIRKMLPGGHKDEKPGGKPAPPKIKLFNRIFGGVNTLVRDPGNLLFGEHANYELNPDEEADDDVDTDNLHRYAQQLRDREDQDREVNPEFLVLQDGKTVYGVHESDADGKVKLAKRKPIYDRFADQKPEEQTEKKKLLARLKVPFTRRKDGKDSKSAATTPDVRIHRKSSRKSLNDDLAAVPIDEPLMI